MKIILVVASLLYMTMIQSVIGQKAQRQLTESEYKLWSTLEVEQLSETGNWTSYTLQYESSNDTLFVKHTKTAKTYTFAGGTNGQFAKENFFACQDTKGQLLITQLKTGKLEVITQVSSYAISSDGQFVIAQRKTTDAEQELLIKNLETKQETTLPKVTTYSYNAKANAVVCDSEGQLVIVAVTAPFKKERIETNTLSTYSDIVWQKNGEAIAYFSHNSGIKLGYYKWAEKKVYSFDPTHFDNFPSNSELYNASSFDLTIADDGSKVFFGVKPNEVAKDTSGVQIWNTADKSIYPERKIIKGYTAVPKVGVWWPKTNTFRMLTNLTLPYLCLTGDQNKALLFNPISNKPQFDRSAPIDFYITNIETGKQKLFLKNQSPDEYKLSVSGGGKQIAYFKDKNWWTYNNATEEHINLTKQIGVSFERENYDWSGEKEACGIAGWTNDDNELLIYDNYDVWLVKTDGSKYTRLTQGREEKTIYRIIPQSENNFATTKYNWLQKGTYNLSEGLLLQAKSSTKNGYCSWDKKRGIQQIVFSKNQVSNIKRSPQNDSYRYTEEHFNQAPQIVFKSKNNEPKIIFQSNPQQKNYQWGFSKVITYFNSKDQELHGALFYPAGFQAEKSYPMVVHIYEQLSEAYNHYVNPSLWNDDGFNVSNLTSQGYFVLLPDIVYEEGNVGRCAVDCVVSAVNEVLANESVDPKRIGLTGHSFGGYETNFIITQTNIFAAAISSAGVSNIVNDYLYMGWNIAKTNFWRYEYNQMRMGTSLFDDPERYLKNAPITYAKQVQTPLLLWSGEEDKQVHHYQSIEFHLALRRLQKPNILVLYEGERHNIRNKNHQIDLTHRVQQWWDYYLKKGKQPEWFTKDKY